MATRRKKTTRKRKTSLAGKAAKAVTSLIPSNYIPAKVRRDPKTGKIKIAIQPNKLKKSTRTRK